VHNLNDVTQPEPLKCPKCGRHEELYLADHSPIETVWMPAEAFNGTIQAERTMPIEEWFYRCRCGGIVTVQREVTLP